MNSMQKKKKRNKNRKPASTIEAQETNEEEARKKTIKVPSPRDLLSELLAECSGSLAKLLVFVLSHFNPPLAQDTGHVHHIRLVLKHGIQDRVGCY